ncbi:MAG: hypothetical protein LBL04_12410 [Bacteroidales bacterium]|nr:hypothetical protein [Bacteroidales bacterium]
MQEKMMRIVLIDPVILIDPDRSADPVRSGAAPTPVRNADLSGCVAETRCIASFPAGVNGRRRVRQAS